MLLERANANSDSMLMEFIKFDSSEVLKKREEESTEKKKLMKDVIETIGTDIVDQRGWQPVERKVQKHIISYRHPSVVDPHASFLKNHWRELIRWKADCCIFVTYNNQEAKIEHGLRTSANIKNCIIR